MGQGTPSGYRLWCQMVGLNPWHPETWSADDHRLYLRWTLDGFREKWRRLSQKGMPTIIRAQHGRESLINHIRQDLREALQPLVRNPWRACPCHPRRVGTGKAEGNPWDLAEYPAGTPRRERVLRWLQTEFGERR